MYAPASLWGSLGIRRLLTGPAALLSRSPVDGWRVSVSILETHSTLHLCAFIPGRLFWLLLTFHP